MKRNRKTSLGERAGNSNGFENAQIKCTERIYPLLIKKLFNIDILVYHI
jgi:hypothetical protein